MDLGRGALGEALPEDSERGHCNVEVRFSVSLVDLKRAVRRLLLRLGDESTEGEGFVVFDSSKDSLEIKTINSSEQLSEQVLHLGAASVPTAVFCAVSRTLRFHRRKRVEICFSPGMMTIDSAVIRHPRIDIY